MNDRQSFIRALAHWAAAGKLDDRLVLPAVEELAGTGAQPEPLLALLGELEGETSGALAALGAHLRETLRKEALRFHEHEQAGQLITEHERTLLGGLSLEVAEAWTFGSADLPAAADAALRTARELGFLAVNQQKAPRLFQEVRHHATQTLAAANAALVQSIERLSPPLLSHLESAWATDLPGRERVLASIHSRRRASWTRWLEKAGRAAKTLPEAESAEPDDKALLTVLEAQFAATSNREHKAQILDCLCGWITPAAVPTLQSMASESWAQDRAMIALTLRFGQPALSNWQSWVAWLVNQARLWQSEQDALSRLIQEHPQGLLLILYSQLLEPDPAALDRLVRIVAESDWPLQAQDVVWAWAKQISLAEQRALLETGEEPPALVAPPVIPAEEPAGTGRVQAQPPPIPSLQATIAAPAKAPPPEPEVVETVPPSPPKPSLWENHIQPFFVENWYIVAGIAMVILGSSLLAYYTWDKHWLVRYTIMPSLLACFTWSLAGVGRWIEKKGSEFKGTAAILRGAAIGLLPINFMAMGLLSADEEVPQKGPALLVMALLYLALFGWGLRNWCAAVEPALGRWLAATLLFLNALVGVGPLARTVGHLEGEPLLICLGAGFYLGFFVTAATIVHFTRRILTREMAEEKRVPWFVAAALAITYLQVFIWVHGFMRHLPQAQTYALLMILVGWLVLHTERRALQLRESPQLHGGESFLGFAFVLLGILMGFTDPTIRIAAFALAGVVWMYQALSRRHPLHYWLALTLWGLAVAAVGLLPQYPGPWLPLLGVAAALGFGAGGLLREKRVLTTEAGARTFLSAASLKAEEASDLPAVARETSERTGMSALPLPGQPELAAACRGMQVVALVVTTMVAPLVQWHYRSAPLATAGWLTLVAALFAWRSFKDRQIHWLHATMTVLALVLPYVGFVDMAGRTPHHNTMVFGLALLSWLWLGLIRLRPLPLLMQARSTVLWFYGILAVTAMLLRVALGDAAPEPLWYRDYMEYLGPLLMMLALIPATYHSRSLVPAGMAAVLMTILFPELRANLHQTFPWMGWGTGLVSSICALVLVWLCFLLRPWAFLKSLPEGDRFLGKELFPLRRDDYTLFTWPLMASALYLIIKVDTWHLIRNQMAGGVQLKTAIALGITGVAWTFTAIYHRTHRAAVAGVHLGWIALLAGIGFGYWRSAEAPHWSWPFLITGLVLQGLYWFYRFGLQSAQPWAKELLTEPTRAVLLAGSGALAIVSSACLLDGEAWQRLQWLNWFLAAQLCWHSLRSRHWVFGALLFFLAWISLLAATAPGSDALWARVSIAQSVTPTLWLLVGVQLLFAALENARSLHAKLEPLLTPIFVLASTLAFLAGLGGLAEAVHVLGLSMMQQALVLAALVLTARAQSSAFILLPGMLLGYLMIHREFLSVPGSPETRLELLVTPWRLALLGLGMTLLTQAGRWVQQRKAALVTGPFAQPFFRAPSAGWLFWPAAIFSGAGALYHTFDPALRESAAQLWSPYLAALTFALVAGFWGRKAFFAGAGLLLVLGNVHLVRAFGGDALRGHGLSELHLICLGLGFSLLQASLLRWVVSALTSRTSLAQREPALAETMKAQAAAAINRASLGLAALILALLTTNYFTESNLANITSTRFVASGMLAWLAGWYFRRAARYPGPGEAAYVDLCEALYHFGVVLAIWCASLLVPWFRQPLFTLLALALPVLYFYGRAELATRAGLLEARPYRNSAAVLGFVVLGLYVLKGVFHIILFPGTPIGTQYYHYNAPLIMLLGVVLLRLQGLGGTSWLALYGGLALMGGSFFSLTAIPGFSPFDYPMPSAWCALLLGHFWILVSHARSPLRTAIQRLARLDEASWHSLRWSWGLCLLASTQAAVLWGIADYAANTYMVAPLLAGAATIFIHQGIIRRSPLYLVVAALEVGLALHMDFLTPSYIPKEQVIWAILVLWLGLLVAYQFLSRKLPAQMVSRSALALAALVLAHVFYHYPWSDTGLWGMALAAGLAAWTPQRERRAANAAEKVFGALLLWVPAWLVYFSQAPFANQGTEAVLAPWPILATTTTLFLIGLFARLYPMYWAGGYRAWPRIQFRLFDSTLGWLESAGPQVHQVMLWLTLAIVGALQVAHYQAAFAPREIVLVVLLEAGLAVAWFYEGRNRQSMLAYYLMQLAAAACFASLRRHLMLTTSFWTYEYDVWASLACSFSLAGAKQVFDLQPRALRVPLLTSLCMLPALALVWVVVHGLGVNLALLVVGLHSVMFAYLGKDSRESPYNIAALAGFVAFILVMFYSKLHLRAVHAYVIPVGLGVLVLQELFQRRIIAEARNWIRLLTLMAMMGSAGYYALADVRHPITFNLTMILLCLLAMGLGSFMRIRLYLALGFAGLMVDLVSILYKVLVLMERSARMTVIGSLVLLIGAVLVFGAIYYKTNKAQLDALGNKWRLKLAQWD